MPRRPPVPPPEPEDDDDNEFMDEEVDSLNEVEHLPEQPLLTSRQTMDDLGGGADGAVEPIGTATSPLLWAQAASFPGVTQLRVWHMDNGNPVLLGTIDARATDEDFIRHFLTAMPRPGEGKREYLVRPIDRSGRDVGHQFRQPISEHNVYLARLRAMQAEHAGPVIMPQPSVDGMVMKLVGDALARAQASEERAQNAAAAERAAAADLHARMADERVAVAGVGAQAVQAGAERMMELDRQRHEQHLATVAATNDQQHKMMTGFFSSTVEMLREDREHMKARHDQELESMRARHALTLEEERSRRKSEADERREERLQAKQEFEQRMIQERQAHEMRLKEREVELAEQRRRDEQAAAAAEAARQRQFDMLMAQMKLEGEMRREHDQRMHELALRAAALTNQQSTSVEVLVTKGLALAESLGIDVKGVAQRLISGPQEDGSTDALYQLANTVVEQVGGVIATAVSARAATAAAQVAAPVVAQSPANASSALAAATEWADEPDEPEVTTTPPAKPAAEGMSLIDQRSARSLLRSMVQEAGNRPEVERGAFALGVISDAPVVQKYIQAVGMAHAFTEAGADASLIPLIVSALHPTFSFPG